MTIRLATSDDEIRACFPVMRELRPHLKSESFVETIRQMQQAGYSLAYLTTGGVPLAVAGFRQKQTLFCESFLYVDDLVTLESDRSKGYGAALLDWLKALAKERKCSQLHLDSGMQRPDAHRFYQNNGMEAAGYHFRVNA